VASCFLMQDQRNTRSETKNRGNSVVFFLSPVLALELLKLCARKVHFHSRRVMMRKIRDPDGRKMI